LTDARRLYDAQKYRQAERLISEVLEKEEQSDEAYFLLSQIKAGRGLLREQIECLKKAAELNPDCGEYLACIGQAYLNRADYDSAQRFASAAIQKQGNSADTYSFLGDIFHSVGQYEKSVEAIRKAIELEGGSASRYYGLGVGLTLCGRIAEAQDVYRQATTMDPHHAKALPGLSKISCATNENNNIDALRSLAEITRNPWMAINVYHGLAKELDDLGRYEEAYATLEEGKKRLRPVCPHDPFAGADRVRGLADFYAGLGGEDNDSTGHEDNAPIFVVGMPRTGTTVVERILTNHNDVTTVGERPQFGFLLKAHCGIARGGKIDANVLMESWGKIDFGSLGRQYIDSVRYLAGSSQHFVDKLPLNVLYAGAIMSALPKAKVVCLVRDALDTVIGNYRQAFEYETGTYAFSLDLDSVAMYVSEFMVLADVLQQRFPSNFYIVKYEHLVNEPHACSQAMFDFCGLEWRDSFLHIHKNPLPVGSASASQVQVPIHSQSTGRSKRYSFCLDGARSILAGNGVKIDGD